MSGQGDSGDERRAARLGRNELARYARHLVMPEVGLDGQRALKSASVLCLGLGGLGSAAATYLAAAGVGRLGLIDGDIVDYSNLQRQILHSTGDVGRRKLNSARDRLRALNPDIQLEQHPGMLGADNARRIVADYDIVLDGSDNYATRYLANDVCFWLGRPLVYGAIFRFDGQAGVFAPHLGGGCYRCMMPAPPPADTIPSCAEGGVLGLLPGLVGTIQATEAVKLALGIGKPLLGRLLTIDTLSMRFAEIALARDPGCALCGARPTVIEPVDYGAFCGEREHARGGLRSISPGELDQRLAAGDPLQLVDVREPGEHGGQPLDGSLPLPASQLPARLSEIDPAREVVLVCGNGVRSESALELLADAGFTNARHLDGGLDAWRG